ncbi:MAG: helix-hairpin-helix domain-containing protein [Syntrophobacterales bacterium]|nr:helix-hairpin-helix domain-containing protein [Syntrophobacterales bacterium]
MIELEMKGIPTLNIPPSKLLQQVINEKNEIISGGMGGNVVKGDNKQGRLKEGDRIDYDEIIDGYEFIATLSPTTPLKALNHHREKIKRTGEAALPNYGDSRHGIWLPFFNDERYFKPPSKAELRELEFLKKFRKTYESDVSHDKKHEIISGLFKEYNDMSSQISRAAGWYLWELMEISGISASIAKVMYFEGIKSKKNVEMASDKELLNIPGIGPGRLKQIRAYF